MSEFYINQLSDNIVGVIKKEEVDLIPTNRAQWFVKQEGKRYLSFVAKNRVLVFSHESHEYHQYHEGTIYDLIFLLMGHAYDEANIYVPEQGNKTKLTKEELEKYFE